MNRLIRDVLLAPAAVALALGWWVESPRVCLLIGLLAGVWVGLVGERAKREGRAE